MRPFLSSPKNGVFAGGIIFALGLHLGGEKCDLKKCLISRQIFSCKNTSFCREICRCRQIYRQICREILGLGTQVGRFVGVKKGPKILCG